MRSLAYAVCLVASSAGALLTPGALQAQGVLVITNENIRLPRPTPRPQPISYSLDEVVVEATLKNQLADVQVSQTFRNSGTGTIQAQFVFPLPYDGAIDAMTLLVNGKELPAKLMKADEARDRYQSIVRSQKDPALLEWVGTGMFQTSVFPIPAGESRTVSIHYSQLLRKDHELTEFLFPLSTAKYTSTSVKKVRVQLAIESDTNIKNIYSPTHDVSIQRPTGKRATVKYEKQNIVPSSDFRLFYDAKPGDVSAKLLTYRPERDEDGYFLLLATPEIKADKDKKQSKTVIFVVDKSGSMAGKKIEQARDAAKFILNNLHEGDLFNIVSYDSKVQSFLPELEVFDKRSRQEALAYVDSLFAGGGTNIHEALTTALSGLQDKSQPSYVLFMTDGRPTSGETKEALIAEAARQANGVRARVMSFGVGYDVNSRLLDRISSDHHGLSEYVRPDQDIEEHVAKVFNRISSPVMTNVKISYEFDKSKPGKPVNRVYPGGDVDLFEGEQLVIVGRYREFGAAKIQLTGTVQEKEETLSFEGKFTKKVGNSSNSFIEKLWATRRIGEIIDELDLKGKNEELVNELVMLSTKHGILTPYTSFLADETVRPELASSSNRRLTTSNLSDLEEAEGRGGFLQRGIKQRFKNANNSASDASESLRTLDEFKSRPASGGTLSGPAPGRSLSRQQPSSPLPPNGGGAGFGSSAQVNSPTSETAPVDYQKIVRKAGTQTVYKRGKLLVTPETASLDLEKEEDKAKVIEIKRYSKEYFELTDANSTAENEVLTLQEEDEELLVKFRGKIYLIK
ncbi:VIT domain-containing protein [Thalassoglobus polymorphus]|uniref:von Willebrand factor type A domain protein n=1 Tax=Thalassoglobus polymorphus TaxID=2527994 RepID=A0A517QJ34_9PLAN|nr:VIT domain-containing protein [Thalassoglobus polymorphus]QDT31662.1 von Willebrand factor type A domain protein [Thalassoglobus polymorphus]